MRQKNSHFGEICDATTNRNLTLPFRFFKKYALAQGRVKLHKFNLTLGGLSILARPNYMFGLRGLKP